MARLQEHGLAVGDEAYATVKARLLAEGVIGTGRGGSIYLASMPPNDAEVFALETQSVPAQLDLTAAPAKKPSSGKKTREKKKAATAPEHQVLSYRFDAKRKNNPHVGMVDTTSDGVEEAAAWAYDPHIDPALQFDPNRAEIENLIDDALVSNDKARMAESLAQLKRTQAAYLNWAGKAERTSFAVDTVSLHVHERIDPATILAGVQKRAKDSKAGDRRSGGRQGHRQHQGDSGAQGADEHRSTHRGFEEGPVEQRILLAHGPEDVGLRKRDDGRYEVEVHGFDYFDTQTGALQSGGKQRIAVWELDTDYDNRSLFPRQVFFPMAGGKDGWYKLKKDIRAELDEGRLEAFHGTVSLPFAPGENECVAVKIVDDRGIESLKVINLG
jgi:hypothetical protein